MVTYVMDEMNIIVPYSDLGKKEANELMFMPYHMASMASSSLVVGYHQDVNLGAHMLTMAGTMVGEKLWESVSSIAYDLLWKEKYATYCDWLDAFQIRCDEVGVDRYHGRSLYSTILPEDLNWSSGKCKVVEGILTHGTLDKGTASGTSGSLGMVLYRVYGSDVCVQWLNASYLAMNEFLVKTGITLGIDDIELPDELQRRVNESIRSHLEEHEHSFPDRDVEMRPEIKARYDASILQDLNNIRERVAKMIIEYLTNKKRMVVSRIELHMARIPMTIDHSVDGSEMLNDHTFLLEYDEPVEVELNMYDGYLAIGSRQYSMGVYPIIYLDGVKYERETPSPLLMMTYSGARGNETNIIQISGIIGQQSFANGRIPLMMSDGTRTMPCFQFNENTPESRGHIASSYREGMSPSAYVAAHVASRENLTSNTDLTPKTGYFARRLRVFMENLRIVRKGGRQLVANESGAIMMWDFMMDPTKMFTIKGRKTFIDIAHELRILRKVRSKDAIIVTVPYRKRMSSYLSVNRNVEAIRTLYPTMDIILSMDPLIESRHPDFYEYMRDRYIVITGTDNPYWYLESWEYDRLLVVPSNARLKAVIDLDKLQDGYHINISQAGIDGISYQSKQGEKIGSRTLYDMLTLGTDFTSYPMVIKTGIEATDVESLLISMIETGDIYAI